MSEIIPVENAVVHDADEQMVVEFDPENPSKYFFDSLSFRMNKAKNIAEQVYQDTIKEAPTVLAAGKAFQGKYKLVVVNSDKVISAINKGLIKLTKEKGKFYAQIRNGNKYGKKLPIKKEYFSNFNPSEFANAVQMAAIQEQLDAVYTQALMINSSIHEVLQGQQDDRVGLYMSGVSLYLESRLTDNPVLANELKLQAIRTISDATYQIAASMQSDIKYLKDKEYRVNKKEQTKLIEEHINGIENKFGYIHQAMLLKAAIYCDEGELKPMSAVLQQYSKFIENTISPNSLMLAQLCNDDDGSKYGKWKQRAELQLDVSGLAKALSTDSETIYIGINEGGDDNNGSNVH